MNIINWINFLFRDATEAQISSIVIFSYVVFCFHSFKTQLAHLKLYKVESSSGAVNDVANTMMQKFWDSALALEPADDYDTQRSS